MIIAVLSGKGGTGKTTVSASLSIAVNPSQYIDCDVEEPNGHIFLKPQGLKSEPVEVEVPCVDEAICTGCGDCAKACQFNSIAVVNGKVLFFPELCHHCGACYLSCKVNALSPIKRTIGVIETDDKNTFAHGKLNIGEPVAVPVISKLKSYQRDDVPIIIDCCPGASCTVVSSLEDADFCLLVTEPTPFGLHDLIIAVSLVRLMNKPFGIVINKALNNNSLVQDYCKKEGIDILMEIPYSKEIAENYSKGILPVDINDQWAERFVKLYDRIKGCVK
ncbi:MAG TPA: ATP-binding protein [Clostridia bacterium]|nr:ATP-binding protein [Clostridia bacterium]